MAVNKLKFLSMQLRTKGNLIKRYLVVLSLLFFSINQCHAVSVGDSYGGGTVFCVSQTPDITKCVPQGSGKYGLIMANEDQVNYDSNPKHGVTWASKSNEIFAAQSVNDGRANTAAIVAAHPKDNADNNAAWLCRNYRDSKGYDDWYLPSENELARMYVYAGTHGLIGRDCSGSKPDGIQCLIGGDREKTKAYWSSTERSGDHAWYRSFKGSENYFSKVKGFLGVRAIRDFVIPIQQLNDLLAKDSVSVPVALAVMAGSPDSDLGCLKFVCGHADIDATGLIAVARHRNVTVDLLIAIAGHPRSDSPTLLAVVQHPLTNEEVRGVIISRRGVSSDVLDAIAVGRGLPPAMAEAAAVSPVDYTRTQIRVATTQRASTAEAAAASPVDNAGHATRRMMAASGSTRYATGEAAGAAAAASAAPSSLSPICVILTKLFSPDYQSPTLIQALTDAGIPSPEEVFACCDKVAASAIIKGQVNCARLTREDVAAIAVYTYDSGGDDANNNPYRLINRALSEYEDNPKQLRKSLGLVYKLLYALRRVEPLHPQTQTLYRGIRERVNLTDDHYHQGNTVTWDTFSSTTIKMQTTKNFLTDPVTGKCEGTLFIIHGTPWGYNLQPFSCFPDEKEILLEPGIAFKVIGVIDPPAGLTVVDLEMLPNQRLLLERLIPIGKEYVARKKRKSKVAGELSFNKGDVIYVIDPIPEDWWQGELNGQRGLVPSRLLDELMGHLEPGSPAPAPRKF